MSLSCYNVDLRALIAFLNFAGKMRMRRSILLNGRSFPMMNVIGNLSQTFLRFSKKLKNLIEFSLGVINSLQASRRATIVMPQNPNRNIKNFNIMIAVPSFFLEVHHLYYSYYPVIGFKCSSFLLL